MVFLVSALPGMSPPTGAVAGFGDVESGRYFTLPVQWAANNGIIDAGRCFLPDDPVSRGDAAEFMWRMEGSPEAEPHGFTDVAGSLDEAVSWLSASGVTTGTTPTTFSPDQILQRGQIAAFLWRLADRPAPSSSHSFVDVHAAWQHDPVSWMSQTGITTGTSGTTFSPAEILNRAQLVTFLHRYKGSPDVTVDPATPTCDAAAPETTDEVGVRSDVLALTELYRSTKGPEWTNNSNWLTDAPLDEWHGVELDESGRVTTLRLTRNNLSGEIPPEIGNLTELTELQLTGSLLSGEIPPEIGSLTQLTELRLNNNRLEGEIPPEIGNLTELTDLRLGRNLLRGRIPPEISNLTELTELRLNNNRLEGEIPPEIGNLTELEGLYLFSNRLSGQIPAELGRLSRLDRLILTTNVLEGSIPPELGNLAQLTELRLEENKLSGPVPVELSRLSRLVHLRLHTNRLSGTIPPELGELAELKYLRLNRNGLRGEIPPELSNLAELLFLDLTGNSLSGSLPPELSRLTQLSVLRINDNDLSGPIPAEYGDLTNLTELGLLTNSLTGQIPPELGKLSNLQILQVSENPFGGEIPPELGNLTKLRFLWLHTNNLSGAIPSELGNLSNLGSLEMNDNALSGEIPAELGNLTSLTSLGLFKNRLSGEIPPELGKLTKLESLRLNVNNLSGDVPSELGNLDQLTFLDLSQNRLSGDIPAKLIERANSGDLWLIAFVIARGVPTDPVPTRVAPSGPQQPVSATINVALAEAFGSQTFSRPTDTGAYPLGEDRPAGQFVADQSGRLLLVPPDDSEAVEILNLTGRVATPGNHDGLLSVALDPDFEENGHLWVSYIGVLNNRPVTRLSRFTADPADPRQVSFSSELVILEIDQATSGHRGGAVRFGNDKMLYLSVGDGSWGGDLGNHGQNTATLPGTVLRIDVSRASPTSPYTVPPDNPFVDSPGVRPEIWAYGFRNLWRMAFDPVTGSLWGGDVGQFDVEEVNLVESGGNYGWSRLEGTACFRPLTGCTHDGTVLPVVQYNHDVGCAVTGGVVYRGSAVPELVGHYLFADLCKGQLWALPLAGGPVIQIATIPRQTTSFGTDAEGEVYLTTIGGAILRIVPAGA